MKLKGPGSPRISPISQTRDREFESVSLQRRVCELSVPLLSRPECDVRGIGLAVSRKWKPSDAPIERTLGKSTGGDEYLRMMSRSSLGQPCRRRRRVKKSGFAGRLAPARKPDCLVHRSSDCSVEGRATCHARRPAALLGVGDHDSADAAGGFRLGATPDRRADRIHSSVAGS